MVDTSVDQFPSGTHAQITGLAAKPELNDDFCVSRGPNPDNAERLFVLLRSGARLSIRPANLRPAELLPGSRVTVVGLTNAAQYNGQIGEVLSWQGDRWIVDLESKERKSFRADNLVIMPARVNARKRPTEEPEPEVKKLKTSDLREIESTDETVVARALARALREFPILPQKCICCLATKQTVTVMHELATHLTDKQNDGLLRRPLQPGVKVKGIEELDAEEQCLAIAERRTRALAGMVRINYCDLLGFIKQGFKEPAFNRARRQ
mmetsp:Transcript_100121/g.311928  ORF Transcript_100121/g.311928 Transcript_100121/m.311928 type:complete len:266 (+) Transcript_100121:90-887(+)|eukprot:CAMPEP_0204575728 /NCGR_PEP_ID=MMETSP0661-20131031/41364_1 /ASSEMBLY_ACC=CAM_ASM_000606 /TAXON_ID=109239 /ORGANISM="Alexandrium margalefi, Strain AMGDE01CS-322" /LENGTH=265 /DNA_ID=CAMNT_0051584399 /DNA_START=30 /DNA_END=827 /DNA_ORIENTATION=+